MTLGAKAVFLLSAKKGQIGMPVPPPAVKPSTFFQALHPGESEESADLSEVGVRQPVALSRQRPSVSLHGPRVDKEGPGWVSSPASATGCSTGPPLPPLPPGRGPILGNNPKKTKYYIVMMKCRSMVFSDIRNKYSYPL